MAKRLIVPTKQIMAVAAGIGEVTIPSLEGIPGRTLTYLVIEKVVPSTPPPKGKVEIFDVDNTQVIRKDPKPGNKDVFLDFYHYEMRIDLNGVYKVRVNSLTEDGDYVVYTITVERPQNV